MTVGRRLEGKVAMITGGASGIGGGERPPVRRARRGGVAIADLNDNLGRRVADEIAAAGGSALYHHLDTSSEDEWREAMEAVMERFGRLDVMLNAAGVSGRNPRRRHLAPGRRSGARQLEPCHGRQRDRRVPRHQARDSGRCSRPAAAPSSTSRRSTESSARSTAPPTTRRKGAVRTFTKAAAAQYATQGIRVNSVHPGFVDTTDDPAHPRRPGAFRTAARADAGRALRTADRHRPRLPLPRLGRVGVDDRPRSS